MQQDFLLIRKMKNGDEEAMDTFVRQYYAQILQYCSYHCPDREWAQDLTQETFARFFRRLADYKHHGKSLNYLYTIARNLCIDWGRKNREFAMEYEDVEGADDMSALEEKLLIEAALGKLPAQLREVVILRFFQELSVRETADVLQIGIPLVKYRIRKAKEALRGLLGDEPEGGAARHGEEESF
ncbi:MAG: RNA polymerase sigma factor [Blautia sp.]|nr:RNA polymerase sigma factor [Blautia sp.]MCM1200696.1 RNA polymerase sigma factor [Bacteroides fragilis]